MTTATNLATRHPLDPLNAEEVNQTTRIVNSAVSNVVS